MLFPVVVILLFLAVGLYAFVLRSVSGFERKIIQEDMEWISRGIFSILDEEYYQLLVSGNAADERFVLIAKGQALGRLEDFIRQRSVRAHVDQEGDKDALMSHGISPETAVKISRAGPQDEIHYIGHQGEKFYAYYFQFEPWRWNIYFSKGITGYSTLLARVRSAHAATAAILLLTALLLYWSLNRHIRRPVAEILEAVSEGKHPQYRGIHEFEFLGRSIHQMMHTLEDNTKWIDSLLSTVGALVIVMDPGGKIVLFNQTCEEVTGFDSDVVIGRYLWDFLIPHTSVPQARESFTELAEKREPTSFEGSVLTSSGQEITVLWNNTFITGEDDEIKWLIATGIDISKRIRMQTEIEEREHFLSSIFSSIQDGISILDTEMNIIGANPTMEKWYSHKTPIVGKKCWEVYHRRDSQSKEYPSHETLQTRKTSFQIVPRIGDDGSTTGWLELYSFPFIDMTSGSLKGVIEYVRDITDRKAAEERLTSSLEEKEILLKEVHHRVKNNLQVISGLLNLQAHHITDEKAQETYKESQNRVVSMALIHQDLYQSKDLAQVNFADHVRNLAENLFASYGIKDDRVSLIIEAENLELVVDTAIPCGLVVNELLSNSLKHGFPGGRKGEIRINFAAFENGNFILTVADNGVGFPVKMDPEKTDSLGMQLVSVLVQQLGGTLELDRTDGTSFTITFKEYHEAGTVLHFPG
jgi:PAS domain S-box-containing protein